MITSFCILAEPERLMYPYIESLRSVSRFSDKIVVTYAAAKEDQTEYRKFEKESYDKLISLGEEIKDRCDLVIRMNDKWKLQRSQSYEEIRNIVQSELYETKSGWFLKFDADNVFRKDCATQIRGLFNDELDKIVFRRINVTNRKTFGINLQSEDIYAINLDSLNKKNIRYEIGDSKNWCRVVTTPECSVKIVSDVRLIPVNYDATFFTRERVIDFWRKTEEAYCAADASRSNKLSNLSDAQVIADYKSYRRNKIGSSLVDNFTHPEDISERMKLIDASLWGYNNFESTTEEN